ncbi:MAG: hypothetical protein EAX96_14605 [Candidatus Lokiarchaeota archaeon]|nr:hypothetical protein [Candidatus Lokiarchaeota archaeon]
MFKRSVMKYFLICSILTLLLSCFLCSPSLAYGTDIFYPEPKNPGIYHENFTKSTSQVYAYYKVSCNESVLLNVTLIFSHPTNYLNLTLLDHNDYVTNESCYNITSNNASQKCLFNGDYKIIVGATGTDGWYNFTLLIEITDLSQENPNNIQIPGFEFLFIIVSLVFSIGLFRWQKKKNLIQ